MPYPRGHVRLPNKDHLMLLSDLRNRHRLRALRQLTPPPTWDSRAKGLIGPIKNQGQCGSCWCFSGTDVCDVAFYLAGAFRPDGSDALSEQYTLDCGNNGGCNGDDNVTVLQWAQKTGLPKARDYGPYQQSSGRCKWQQSETLYKIDQWGFVDGSQGNGVTDATAIKQAIMTYGIVGCAVAAGGSWDSWSSDPNYVHSGNSHSIDHDVSLVGWDDAKGAWNMRNNWGTGWANQGYGWIKYGADDIGTEAVFALVRPVNPPGPLDPDLWD